MSHRKQTFSDETTAAIQTRLGQQAMRGMRNVLARAEAHNIPAETSCLAFLIAAVGTALDVVGPVELRRWIAHVLAALPDRLDDGAPEAEPEEETKH